MPVRLYNAFVLAEPMLALWLEFFGLCLLGVTAWRTHDWIYGGAVFSGICFYLLFVYENRDFLK